LTEALRGKQVVRVIVGTMAHRRLAEEGGRPIRWLDPDKGLVNSHVQGTCRRFFDTVDP
jgi:hypothetical protein